MKRMALALVMLLFIDVLAIRAEDGTKADGRREQANVAEAKERGGKSTVAGDEKSATAGTAAPGTRPADEKVLVTIDDHRITEQDTTQWIRQVLKNRNPQGEISEAQVRQVIQQNLAQILNTMVDQYLLDREAKKNKVEISEEEISERVDDLVEGFAASNNLTEEQLDQRLRTQGGVSLSEYREQLAENPDFVRNELHNKLIRKQKPDMIDIDAEDIKAHYDRTKAQRYQQQEQVRASHILLKVDQNADEDEKKKLREKLVEIRNKAKAEDADFAALAGEHSDCPSKSQGGDLGYFPREGKMVEPFARAAFELKVGELSEIVETQFGYHIIKVTDRQEARTVSLEEVEGTIREELERRAIQNARAALLRELHEKTDVDYADSVQSARPTRGPGVRPAPGGQGAEEKSAETKPAS